VPGDGMRSARTFVIILVVHLVVIVLWQVLVDAFAVPKFILSSPLATLATLTSAKYAWLSNLAVTAVEILADSRSAPSSA
jgi:NitT/TauT family transport system permease protein